MRLSASEKLEIIGLVEQSHLPARGVPSASHAVERLAERLVVSQEVAPAYAA